VVHSPIPYLFRPLATAAPFTPGLGSSRTPSAVPVQRQPWAHRREKRTRFVGRSGYDLLHVGVYAVVTDVVKQVKAGGLLEAPPDFMSHERAALDALSPPDYLTLKHLLLVREFDQIGTDLQSAKSALAANDRARYNMAYGRAPAQQRSEPGSSAVSALSLGPLALLLIFSAVPLAPSTRPLWVPLVLLGGALGAIAVSLAVIIGAPRAKRLVRRRKVPLTAT